MKSPCRHKHKLTKSPIVQKPRQSGFFYAGKLKITKTQGGGQMNDSEFAKFFNGNIPNKSHEYREAYKRFKKAGGLP
jgi:hypothetical protein